MILDDFKNVVSLQIFSSGKCNLNCSYCYIPKGSFMKELDNQILGKLESGKLLKEIREIYPKGRITDISFVGGEPTLTLLKFIPFLKELFEEHPNIEHIHFSSNFSTNPSIISDFIEQLPINHNKVINVHIQCSIDGSTDTTEKNRGIKAETISDNVIVIVKNINELECIKTNVIMNFKSTIDKSDIYYLSTIDNQRKHFGFFRELFNNIDNANINKKVTVQKDTCSMTFVFPGKYTTEDGLAFSDLISTSCEIDRTKEFEDIKFNVPYSSMIGMLLRTFDKYSFNTSRFGCAAGTMKIVITNNDILHSCHRTIYQDVDSNGMNDDSLNFFNGSDNFSGYDEMRFKMFKKHTANRNDDLEINKMFYLQQSLSDSYKFKYSQRICLLKEMAQIGQILKCYNDENSIETRLLCITLNKLDCLFEDMLVTGSKYLQLPSIARLFANGAFKQLLKREVMRAGL